MGALTYINDDERGCNYLIVILLATAVFSSAYWERYFPAISPLLWFLMALGFALSIWIASYITSRRLMALILTIFVMEYVKETIGIQAGFWRYTGGAGGEYQFGVWMWVLVGLSAFAASVGIVMPFLRAFNLYVPRAVQVLIPVAFFAAVMPALQKPMAPEVAAAYAGFYLVLLAVGILAALSAEFYVLMGVVATSLALGLPSEYAGSAPDHAIWMFCQDPAAGGRVGCLPPVFLLTGCWPLEILAQFAISAWLAGEGLGKYSEDEPEEATMGAILTGSEKRFKWFMAISASAYFVVGFIFLLAPEFTFTLATALKDALFAGRRWDNLGPETGKFWLALAFSMMMTITVLCVIVAIEPRNNKHYAIPLLASKAASALAGLGLFFLSKACFEYLLIFAVDGSLFWLTLVFFLLAYNSGVKATARLFRHAAPSFWKHPGGGDNPEAGASGGLQPGRAVPDTLDEKLWRPGEGGMGGESPSLVVVETLGDKFKMLDAVLEKAKFFEVLNYHHAKSGEPKDKFRVVIKPNIMFLHHKKDVSTYTDPALVERLIMRIHEKGFTNITLVEAQSTIGNYFTNREVATVAEYAGYKQNQKIAPLYRIVDLTLEKVDYDYGGRLGKHTVGPTWRDAHFRVSFAKNKTHVFCNYTLTLKNIYGTLPEQNKLLEYHTKREYDWPTIESLQHFPVHFGLIDAVISADGQFGVITDPTPRKTDTMIGGENLMAVDWVGARKMGLDPDDPSIGRFLPLAVETFGMPTFAWMGDRSVYDPWENVSDVFIKSLDMVEEAYAFSDFFFSGLSAADGTIFKYKITAWPNLLLRHMLKPFKRWYFKYDDLGR
jgi:uncharacterized protein (DUF362 family)